MQRIYIIYDGRAMQSTEDASELDVCQSRQEAWKNCETGNCCFSYLDVGGALTDERFEFFKQ